MDYELKPHWLFSLEFTSDKNKKKIKKLFSYLEYENLDLIDKRSMIFINDGQKSLYEYEPSTLFKIISDDDFLVYNFNMIRNIERSEKLKKLFNKT
jgi:hypothetical protein